VTPYDVVPYLSFPYSACHPDRLSLLGWLFRLSPSPQERCRVLEIGCASGGNLLPQAEMFPESSFVGIDLAATSIAQGNAVARELGLGNIELRHADILDLDQTWGSFDYIICHGVYSWVPAPVREKLLDACAALLAPRGIALVTHNVNPGWHFRALAGGMMRYHTAGIAEPAGKTAEARLFMEFLARTVPEGAYRDVIAQQRDKIVTAADWYLYHDQLAEVNDGCWFWEFADKIAARGLAYLGDADMPTMLPTHLHPEAAEALAHVTDIVKLEQYHDFLTGRPFRLTAMCRAEHPLDRELTGGQIQELWLGSAAACAADPDLDSAAPVEFRTPTGGWAQIGRPATKRAMWRMRAAQPAWLPFAELCDPEEADDVALDLLQAFAAGVVEARRRPPLFVSRIGERPEATPLARLQAARGRHVTSRRHENVSLDETARAVLTQCDGTRGRGDLAEDVLQKLVNAALLVA